jgi:hypothetical protein
MTTSLPDSDASNERSSSALSALAGGVGAGVGSGIVMPFALGPAASIFVAASCGGLVALGTYYSLKSLF